MIYEPSLLSWLVKLIMLSFLLNNGRAYCVIPLVGDRNVAMRDLHLQEQSLVIITFNTHMRPSLHKTHRYQSDPWWCWPHWTLILSCLWPWPMPTLQPILMPQIGSAPVSFTSTGSALVNARVGISWWSVRRSSWWGFARCGSSWPDRCRFPRFAW